MDFFLNPDVIYLLLMLGLWMGATGAYIPGTGLAELGGVALILAALALMTQLATNWFAVVALVLGASLFFLLPLFKAEWERFAILGLVLQAVASFMLFAEAGVSLFWIGLGVLLALAYHRTILRAILRQGRTLSSTQKDEFLVGERGRVIAPIEERGTVHVGGELWTARSKHRLESGVEVIVTRQEGLELHVEKAKRQEAESASE